MSEPIVGGSGETPDATDPRDGRAGKPARETRKRQVVAAICRFGGRVLLRVCTEILADLINPWGS